MKLCVECTHHHRWQGLTIHDDCRHPTLTIRNNIDGKVVANACEWQRQGLRPCGPEGLLWEPKPLTWWEKLLGFKP